MAPRPIRHVVRGRGAPMTSIGNCRIERKKRGNRVVSPKEVIGEEERDRLETQWNQQFRRAGAGKLLVAESEMSVQILNHSMGDLAALADMKASKEDICNAFHVPI